MKHAISIYIDDESEIIGFCGSIVVETDYDKAITCFNFNKQQLKDNNTFHIGQNGKVTAISVEKEDTGFVKEALSPVKVEQSAIMRQVIHSLISDALKEDKNDKRRT